jgi:hypothetical protein
MQNQSGGPLIDLLKTSSEKKEEKDENIHHNNHLQNN